MEPLDDSALDEILSSLKPDEPPEDTPLPSLTEPAQHSDQAAAAASEDGIWTRRDGETAKAYSAFCLYRDMGSGRSLDAAYCLAQGLQKGSKRVSGYWQRWYHDFEWKTRAEAYDAHLDDVKRRAEAQRWRERGEALVEEQYQLARAMVKKVQQMLQFPLVKQTVESENGPVTVEPARWTFNSAARLAKVATELGRLAAGLPTRNEHLVHFDIDPTKLSDDQIERILAGEHPAAVVATPDQGHSVQGSGRARAQSPPTEGAP